MADKIKKGDLFDEGLFDDAIKGAERLAKSIKDLQQGVAGLMTETKNKVQVINPETAKDLQNINKEVQNSVTLIKQKESLDQQALKTAKDLENLRQAQLKTLQQKEVLSQKELKTERDIAKAYADEERAAKKADKEREKAAEISKKLSSTFEQNRKKLKELTSQLVDLKPGTAEFNKLAQEAGKLKDEMQDAKDAVKAFSNESKLATSKTLFSQIGRDLADLDFKGAADKAKVLTQVIGSISFKEIIGGIKNFGFAILDLGKALLFNPVTLTIAGIVALGAAIKETYDAYQRADEIVAEFNETLKKQDGITEKITENIIELDRQNQILLGNLTEQGKRRLDADDEFKNRFIKNREEEREQLNKLREEARKANKFTVTEAALGDLGMSLHLKRVSENNIKFAKTETDIKSTFAKTETKLYEELVQKQLNITLSTNKKTIDAAKQKTTEIRKEIVKQNTDFSINQKDPFGSTIVSPTTTLNANGLTPEEQASIDGQIAAHQKTLDDEKQFREARIEGLSGSLGKEEEIINTQAIEIRIANGTVHPDELKAYNDKIKKIQDDKAKKQQEDLKHIQQTTLNALEKGLEAQSNKRQEFLDKEIKQREDNIDRQKDLAARGLSNTLAFEEAQKAKAELAKEQEKKKEAKRQKAIAFLRLVAGYADKDASTAVAKAVADIALASLFENSFATGVEGLKGAGTETSDSILARLSKNESVITAKGTKENAGLPTAMNEGRVDEYFNNKYLPKVAMESGLNSDTASNMASSMMLNQLIGVNKRLEGLEKAIMNKRETHTNIDNVGNVITTDIEKGFKKVITKMRNRPRI